VSPLTPLAKDLRRLFQWDGDVQRCDAKHPCTPCTDLGEGSECVYERSPATQRTWKKLPAAVQPILFSFKSEPSPCDLSSSWVTRDGLPLSTPDNVLSDTSSSMPSPVPNSSDASQEESCSPDPDTPDGLVSPTLQARSNSEMQRQLGGVDPVDIYTVVSAHPSIDGMFVHPLLPAKLKLISSTPDYTWLVTNEPSTLRAVEVDKVLNGPSSGLARVRRSSFGRRVPLGTNPSISVLSSFLLPAIPPELRIPLSFLGEERLQVQISDATATDMDMKSYVLG